MPDLGLPRVLARGELCAICGTQKGASFGTPLFGFGEQEGTASSMRQPRTQAEFPP